MGFIVFGIYLWAIISQNIILANPGTSTISIISTLKLLTVDIRPTTLKIVEIAVKLFKFVSKPFRAAHFETAEGGEQVVNSDDVSISSYYTARDS